MGLVRCVREIGVKPRGILGRNEQDNVISIQPSTILIIAKSFSGHSPPGDGVEGVWRMAYDAILAYKSGAYCMRMACDFENMPRKKRKNN